MRTREDQISHLSCAIFNDRRGDIDDCMSLARDHILEAERRAEQRVRDEIGKNSERLDWLERQPFTMLQLFDQGWMVATDRITRALCRRTARDAIDAAREVG